MRSFCLKLMAFVAPLILVLVGLDRLVESRVTSVEERKFRDLFDSAQRWPNIVLGTSCAQYAIDPRLASAPGIPLYNFAVRGANPLYQRAWYAAYRSRGERPTRVLLEANWTVFKPILGRRLENDSEYLPPALFFGMLTGGEASAGMLLRGRQPLVKNRAALQQLLLGQPIERDEALDTYARGHVSLRNRPMDGRPLNRANFVPDDERNVVAYRELIRELRRDGATVVLVQPPQFRPIAGDRARESRRVAELAESLEVPFLDYNTALRGGMNEDASLFADWVHMNQKGSQVFSRRLREDLERIGFFAGDRL